MANGIAPEQARLFLASNGLYVRWRWTTSLQGAMHFIELRDEEHAQWEIQEYARAVKELAATKFPECIGGMNE
jgi:thymidylate synthase (FAD)